MRDVVIQAAVLIAVGFLWRRFQPLALDGDGLRRHLTGLVYVLLLPALVLSVLWSAPLGLDALRVALLALVGLGVGFSSAWLWFRGDAVPRPAVGALLLAATFPNVTYMGLPVLEATLGPWARSIAIQYDLFACTPILLSVGVLVAANYGGVAAEHHPARALLRVPPLWAALIGVSLNALQVPMPTVLHHLLEMLGGAVIPLMLFSIGLGLRWSGDGRGMLVQLAPVLFIQLVLTPLAVWGASGLIGLDGPMRTGVVLEAAMPTMVLGIVLCDRYRLDGALYAMAVTLSTALSLTTLPLWFDLVGGG